MCRVLIVDDSRLWRVALSRLLEEEGLEVVGVAANGPEAREQIEARQPDIVTMDVVLGDEDGVDLTAAIMCSHPLPILIVTGVGSDDPGLVFRAMSAGALDVFPKPHGSGHPSHAIDRSRLARALRALAAVPVVTRRHARRHQARRPLPARTAGALTPEALRSIELVLIGASTGGPATIHKLLMGTPAPFPLPIVIVQHIGARFAAGLVRWLDEVTDHHVVLCDGARMPEPGLVYVAPDGVHLRQVSGGALVPVEGPPRNFQLPAIDELFESASRVTGSRAVAFLLTGMGSDGTDGMLELRRAGAITVAQAPETCTIDSMPTSAINEQAAAAVLTPDEIASLLAAHARSLGVA